MRKKRDVERHRKQRLYDKLLISYKVAQGSLSCLRGDFRSSIQAYELVLERRKALYGKFLEKEAVEDETITNIRHSSSGSDHNEANEAKERKIERIYDEDSQAHPDIAHSYHLMGNVMTIMSNYHSADKYFTCAIRHNTLTFGEDHIITATSKLARIRAKIHQHIEVDSKPTETEEQQMRSELRGILTVHEICFRNLSKEIICVDGTPHLCHPSIARVLYVLAQLEKQSDNVDTAYLTFTKCYEIQQIALRKQSLHYLLCLLENCKHVAYGAWSVARHYDLYLRSKEGYENSCKYIGNMHALTRIMSIQHAHFLTTLGCYKESEEILRRIWDLLKENTLELPKATEDLLNFEATVCLGENLVIAGSWTEGLKLLSTLVVNMEDFYDANKSSVLCYKRYQYATLSLAKSLNWCGQYGKALSLITKYELVNYPDNSLSSSLFISTDVVDLLITKAVSLFRIERVHEGGDVLQSIHDVCIFSDLARVAQIVQVQNQEQNDDIPIMTQKIEVPSSHPTHAYYLQILAEHHRYVGNLHEASEYCENALSMILKAYFDIRFERPHPNVCLALLECAIVRVDIAASIDDNKKRKDMVAPIVVAFSEDLVPIFKQSFGNEHAINLYVKGYYGVAVKILGGFRGEQQIKNAIDGLKKTPHKVSEDHIWISRLKRFVDGN